MMNKIKPFTKAMNKSNLFLIVALILLVSCNETSQQKYSSENECKTREMQKCNEKLCVFSARAMCEENLPNLYTDTYLKKVETKIAQRKKQEEEREAKMKEECPKLKKSVEEKRDYDIEVSDQENYDLWDCHMSGFN